MLSRDLRREATGCRFRFSASRTRRAVSITAHGLPTSPEEPVSLTRPGAWGESTQGESHGCLPDVPGAIVPTPRPNEGRHGVSFTSSIPSTPIGLLPSHKGGGGRRWNRGPLLLPPGTLLPPEEGAPSFGSRQGSCGPAAAQAAPLGPSLRGAGVHRSGHPAPQRCPRWVPLSLPRFHRLSRSLSKDSCDPCTSNVSVT